ncbi:hypothetical protein COCMIDRAFT_9813 [Bipolaris oryzae ATCC 44560]|uniref:Zn(2)-C6 fungal-type domain-containing protein n=1 Tax=Bipolaris oryzae ATCC 44560 TaxID=930090 RepID=W6Z9C7_COCMI|nr:uncharacterized protein COCMIDRAFT_9813 [Bipolaris oryzae ATCC 44560]EUC40281.1 hypothetical protein COCMIDRAFT_9813 [Bipolaris oryzae ATCC 44560]
MAHKAHGAEDSTASVSEPREARAAKACLSCRSRKVRCDVAKASQPCTNCRMNSQKCLVVSRASRLSTLSWQRKRSQQNAEAQPAASNSSNSSPDCGAGILGGNYNISNDPSFSPLNVQPSSIPYYDECSEAPKPVARSTVLYSHFPFLAIGNIHMIPAEDLNFLELQGCLHIPMQQFIDDFVQQYFLYVHPFMPLIDEGEFWEAYRRNGVLATSVPAMPLLVFQAMLFSSCTFVPLSIIRGLGYPDLLSARAAFYRKVKLLYDMNTETSPLYLAQTALLLMAWVPQDNLLLNPFRTWLGLAIQHARSINADCLIDSAQSPTQVTDAQDTNPQALRRLWWCCVIADRISPLCAHYDQQITRDDYNFETAKPLNRTDLADEMFRSCVYSAASKKKLLEIFETFMDLNIILTDILPLVARHQDSMRSRRNLELGVGTNFSQYERNLESWFARATSIHPPFADTCVNGSSEKDSIGELDKSVVLHTNLLYIYYHYAKASLDNYRLQCCVSLAFTREIDTVAYSDEVSKLRNALQNSMSSTTSLLEELVQRRLARWLPVGVLACVAMPFALQVINMRLNASTANFGAERPKGTGAKEETTSALRETMKLLSPQYNGVGLIEQAVEQVARMVQQTSAISSLSAWPEFLTHSPSQYLRVVSVIDQCIREGKVAGENDMRAWLESEVSKHSHNHDLVMHDTPSSCSQKRQAPSRATATVDHQSFASWQECIHAPQETDDSSAMPFGLILADFEVE